MTIPVILERIAGFKSPLVCVTGGEPMLQREIVAFLEQLLIAGYAVLLETGGQQSLRAVPHGVVKIVDIKTPGAFREDPDIHFVESREFLGVHFDYSNLECLCPTDEVKIVITGRLDYEWAKSFIRRYNLAERVGAVLFSPCHGKLHPAELSSWLLEDRLPVRLNLQIHKYIWGAETRGV